MRNRAKAGDLRADGSQFDNRKRHQAGEIGHINKSPSVIEPAITGVSADDNHHDADCADNERRKAVTAETSQRFGDIMKSW